MYCSSCGAAVAQSLSYCNRCGSKVGGAKGDAVGKSSDIRPESLIGSIVALFIFGLGAIAVLVGVMKGVAGFDLSVILAVTLLSFMLMLLLESVLVWLLLSGRRAARRAGGVEPLKGQTTKELVEAQARALPEPLSSVTEHTTQTFEPVYSERKSK